MSVPSNGRPSTEPYEALPEPEIIATAMASIDALVVWLKEAGLDSSAIAHFKFNALAKRFPGLADIVEDAKKLIGTKQPLPEVGMTVTELALRLEADLERKIKPAQVNQALVELGFQVRPENGKRIWQLTEAGKEYGMSLLATSRTNDWAGPQVTWRESVVPKLLNYFESIDSEAVTTERASGHEAVVVEQRTDYYPETESERTPDEATAKSSKEYSSKSQSESELKSWTLSERLKVLKKKISASMRLHIEMEAASAYKERHGKPPAKEQSKGKYYDVYPATDLDLVDSSIDRVLKRYAQNS